jgi:hypothetical protein
MGFPAQRRQGFDLSIEAGLYVGGTESRAFSREL